MTAAKLAANRTNAQKSTGPLNTQSTRFNGVQHGLTSKQTVISGESQEAYNNFRTGFLADLNPKSATEDMLAERVVAAAWRLQRFQRIETAFFNDRVKAFLADNPEATATPPWQTCSLTRRRPAACVSSFVIKPQSNANTTRRRPNSSEPRSNASSEPSKPLPSRKSGETRKLRPLGSLRTIRKRRWKKSKTTRKIA